MKLKMHSFDFEECTLTFSVPKDIMHSQTFSFVLDGVEVDLGIITGNAALGIKEPGQMNHKWTGMECLVAHFDKDNNMLPPCKECQHCGWVAFPYTVECVGDAPKSTVEEKKTIE
jgi:hypothetical protein